MQAHHADRRTMAPLFLEILCAPSESLLPDRIQVVTSRVDPKLCGPLLKELSAGSSKDALTHLKRVRRTTQHAGSSSELNGEPCTKKSKIELQVLLGDATTLIPPELIEKFHLKLETTIVPGRSAQSQQELDEFNIIWPTIYFHKKSVEHKKKELELSEDEVNMMVFGMKQAIRFHAVIVDPIKSHVVATAHDEERLQKSSTRNNSNPLSTFTILAIEGVSRQERKIASSVGMNSTTFQQGQYLCTGYDIYLLKEPNVYEAMALVHSRIRRVVFGIPSPSDGGLGGSGEQSAVHSLPGTNHHYRVFQCELSSDLAKDCQAAATAAAANES